MFHAKLQSERKDVKVTLRVFAPLREVINLFYSAK